MIHKPCQLAHSCCFSAALDRSAFCAEPRWALSFRGFALHLPFSVLRWARSLVCNPWRATGSPASSSPSRFFPASLACPAYPVQHSCLCETVLSLLLLPGRALRFCQFRDPRLLLSRSFFLHIRPCFILDGLQSGSSDSLEDVFDCVQCFTASHDRFLHDLMQICCQSGQRSRSPP